MSVLTKLFVVLLVVSSLLLSASVVVFVNRVEDNKAVADGFKTKLNSSNREVKDLTASLAAAQQERAGLQNEMTKQMGELNRNLDTAAASLAESKAKVAQLEKDAQIALATNKGTADALKAAQEENKGVQQALTDSRAKNDELLKQNGELNTQVTALDNKNRQLQKASDYAGEKIVEVMAENAKLRQQLGSTASSAAATLVPDAGPINGVIRSVEIIGGKKYATISVGSSDNVAKGMKFSVVDSKAGKFLGYVIVDKVEPNEAFGLVEGPAVDKVQANLDVKTKL